MKLDTHLTHWLWFDLETTGLWTDDGAPQILQIGGALLPFGDLDYPLWDFQYTLYFAPEWVPTLNPYVIEMHTRSGLLAEAAASTLMNVGQLEAMVLSKLEFYGVAPGNCAPAGSGIAPFDLPLLREHMPRLYRFLHYAPYDLGAGRRMLEALSTMDFADMPDHKGGHTALGDVRAQLEQARWMREYLG